MLSSCLNCRKNKESKNPRIEKIYKGELVLLLKCEACDSKISISIKKQETSELWSNLGIKTPLSKIVLLGDILV